MLQVKQHKCNTCKKFKIYFAYGLFNRAIDRHRSISYADMLIVGGTSLAVYPAAGFIRFYNGSPDNLIVINKTVIPGFKNQLNGSLGELL